MATWTPERVAEIKRLRAERLSLSVIARRMRLTKNQVVGKLNRIAGYKTPPKPGKPRREPAAKAVLAAAIIIDAYEEAMAETGLSWIEITQAVRNARMREAADLREQMEAARHAMS